METCESDYSNINVAVLVQQQGSGTLTTVQRAVEKNKFPNHNTELLAGSPGNRFAYCVNHETCLYRPTWLDVCGALRPQ